MPYSAPGAPRRYAVSVPALALLLSLVAPLARPAALAAEGSDRPTNLLVITLDTWRWDALSAAGPTVGGVATPHLDALAARGALFTHTRVAAPITLVSHASLFTGLEPPRHGVRHNGSFVLGPEQLTLAEILHGEGYRTAAVTAAYVLSSRYGLNQGFDSYRDVLPDNLYEDGGLNPFYPELTATEVTDRAVVELNGLTFEGQRKPWFLWVHYFDAHAPYQAPEPYAARYPNTPYAAEIAYLDAEVGRLLAEVDRRGLTGSTAVVITSDHGEGLGEHGEATHGHFVYDSTVRVPAIVVAPGAPRGQRFDTPVRTIDLLPTLLTALGKPLPEDIDGRPLQALWQQGERRRTAYTESYLPYYEFGWAYLRSLVMDDWKFVQAPRPELYNLTTDPGETHNRLADEPQQAARLAAALERLGQQQARSASAAPTGSQRATVSDQDRGALASLGYIGGLASPPPEDSAAELATLPDPKDRIHLEAQLSRAWSAQSQGDATAARKILDGILKEDPGNLAVRRFAAALAREQGDWDAALVHLAALGERWPSHAWRHDFLAAQRLAEKGETTRALTAYRRLLQDCAATQATDGTEASVEQCLGSLGEAVRLQLAAGDQNGARKTLAAYPTRALDTLRTAGVAERLRHADLYRKVGDGPGAVAALQAIDRDHGAIPDVPFALGNLYREAGRADDAIAAFNEALRRDPAFAPALNNLATLHGMRREYGPSNRYLEALLVQRPSDARALGNLALNYYLMGRAADAISTFQKAIRLDPAAIGPRLNLARVYLEQEKVSQAVALCSEVVRLEPQNPFANEVLRRFPRVAATPPAPRTGRTLTTGAR